MEDMHWRGEATFVEVVDRDEWAAKVNDYIDAVIGAVPHPDATFPEGLTLQNNRVGTEVTGPAFVFSFKVPGEEYEPPPEGNGRAKTLSDALNDLPIAVAEVGCGFQGV